MDKFKLIHNRHIEGTFSPVLKHRELMCDSVGQAKTLARGLMAEDIEQGIESSFELQMDVGDAWQKWEDEEGCGIEEVIKKGG